MATEHDLCKNMGDIDACTDFEMLKVKVSIIFLGTGVSHFLGGPLPYSMKLVKGKRNSSKSISDMHVLYVVD